MTAWTQSLVAAFIAAALAVQVQTWRYEARIADINSAHAAVISKRDKADKAAAEATLLEQQRLTAERDTANDNYLAEVGKRAKERKDAEDKTDQLERDVAAVTRQLRIRATCTSTNPATAGVPQAGTDPVGVVAGTAELDPVARQAYFELRRGIQRQYDQLNICRARLLNQ